MRDFLYNKKKSHLLAPFFALPNGCHHRKSKQRHRQPSQMCLFSFSFPSSVFVYLTQDSRKKQQKGARLTPGSKFLRHVS